MQLGELLLRMVGVFVVFELLVLAVNPLPTAFDEKYAKKLTVLRRVFYYLACLIVAVWLQTL